MNNFIRRLHGFYDQSQKGAISEQPGLMLTLSKMTVKPVLAMTTTVDYFDQQKGIVQVVLRSKYCCYAFFYFSHFKPNFEAKKRTMRPKRRKHKNCFFPKYYLTVKMLV